MGGGSGNANVFQTNTFKDGAGKVLKNMGGDFLDIAGYQQRDRDKQTEKQIAEQNAKLQGHLDNKPTYSSIQNEDGTLKGPYEYNASTVQINGKGGLNNWMDNAKNLNVGDVKNSQATIGPGQNFNQAQSNINALQQRAFGTETSPWAQKLYDQQALQQSGQLDQLGHEQALAQQQQQNNLAMQGGLEGGSRERLAKASARDQMMARQGVFRQGQMDKLNIGINDEAQRMQLQTQMPGMNLQMDQYKTGLAQQDRDVQNQINLANMSKNMQQGQFNAGLNMDKANMWLGANQYNTSAQNQAGMFNTGNAIQNNNLQNAYKQDQWVQSGAILGGQQVADAQARQNKGTGGFLQKAFNMG